MSDAPSETANYVHIGKTVARFIEAPAAVEGDDKANRRRVQLFCNRIEEATLRLLDEHDGETVGYVITTREYFDGLRTSLAPHGEREPSQQSAPNSAQLPTKDEFGRRIAQLANNRDTLFGSREEDAQWLLNAYVDALAASAVVPTAPSEQGAVEKRETAAVQRTAKGEIPAVPVSPAAPDAGTPVPSAPPSDRTGAVTEAEFVTQLDALLAGCDAHVDTHLGNPSDCLACRDQRNRLIALAARRTSDTPPQGAERVFRSADEVEAHYMPETHARRKSVEACDCECHKPRECIRCQHVHDADSRRPASAEGQR